MDTIEDKLERLAQTKSDIRNALLKTGIDVPADAKFSDYITKILEAPCYKFPELEGDVTRWSFKGLTNEQMSKNPSLEDADGKGRFLTFKNFAWSGMSGCGGHDYDFNERSFSLIDPDFGEQQYPDKIVIQKANNTQANAVYRASIFKCKIRITGVSKCAENRDINNFKIWGYNESTEFSTARDGIYDIDLSAESGIFYFMAAGTKGSVEEPLILSSPIIIELLPYYPGFIIGDGVDDYAVTEKNLDFEDTYTVYTAFIPFQEDPARNMLLCGKAYKKDFYVQYQNLNKLMYYSAGTRAIVEFSNGFNLIACKRTPTQMVAKNLLTGETIVVDANSLVENPGLYYLWTTNSKMEYAKAAIAGQVICNGHFTTDEEDTKVLNWYKKEYPWLFFDQAWTVTGKTNEDTDRATITNITGNGNNLVLSNFGFAGNSGYGEYVQNFNALNTNNGDLFSTSKTYKKVTATYLASAVAINYPLYWNSPDIPYVNKAFKLKLSSNISGISGLLRFVNTDRLVILEVTLKEGINSIPALTAEQYESVTKYSPGIVINNAMSVDDWFTLEQIPDHEGYLITDGVDDKIASPAFELGRDFTVVGDWKFINKNMVNAGICKHNSFAIYSHKDGLRSWVNRYNNPKVIYDFINSAGIIDTINALLSNGRIYYNGWKNEELDSETRTDNKSFDALYVGYDPRTAVYAQMAFKNLAIYSKNLSKEDCIKAYIYLQTLKSK